MSKKYGWEILADALRQSQLDLIACVPGKPVTPVQDALVASGDARWFFHEAVAAHYALGASGFGSRAALLVKQVGLNVAADVLACASVHRSGGSMVVIAGDDPPAVSSPTEGDSRRLAVALETPCFEPAGAADLPNTLFEAIEVSTLLQVPVVLRVTTSMLLESQVEEPRGSKRELSPAKAFDPAFWRTDIVGHRRLLLEGLHELAEEDAVVTRSGDTKLRVVASGDLAAEVLVNTDHDLLIVRRVFPHPLNALSKYVAASDSDILVLEDSGPLIEDEIRAHASGQRVLGRRTAHVPWAGPVDAHASIAAAARDTPLTLEALAPYHIDRDADLSPFGTLWADAKELGLTPIAVDAGQCGEAVSLEGDPAPLAYGLGSAIGVAAGIALARGGPAIAVTGDMGAFHAGLLGLVQAVRDQIPVIVIVEDDGAATATGGQPTPTTPATDGERVISLAAVARAIGVEHVETVTTESMARSGYLHAKLRHLARLPGPSVIVIDEARREAASHPA